VSGQVVVAIFEVHGVLMCMGRKRGIHAACLEVIGAAEPDELAEMRRAVHRDTPGRLVTGPPGPGVGWRPPSSARRGCVRLAWLTTSRSVMPALSREGIDYSKGW
jgi:hypothetical protein